MDAHAGEDSENQLHGLGSVPSLLCALVFSLCSPASPDGGGASMSDGTEARGRARGLWQRVQNVQTVSPARKMLVKWHLKNEHKSVCPGEHLSARIEP